MAARQVINAGGDAVDEATIQAFQSGLRGRLLWPGDDAYERARKTFNGMVDKHPALIVRCAGAADVIRGVNFARSVTAGSCSTCRG